MTALKSPSSAAALPSRTLWLAALAGFAAAALLSIALSPREQNTVFDGWQWLSPRDLSQSDVRVVAIGDESLEVIGSWPWPRRVFATLTQRLAEGGASAIGYDIIFAEPDAVSPSRFSRLYPPDSPATEAWLSRLGSMDDEFADAISTAPVVLGRAGVSLGGANPADLTQWATIAGKPPAALPRYPLVQRNLDTLEQRAPGFGLLNGKPDSDGRVRGVPLVQRTGEALVPGLALELARVALEQQTGTDPQITLTPGSVQIGDRTIPIDESGRMRLHFAEIPQDHVYSAIEILSEDFDLDQLRGKTVIVSLTAEGSPDIVATPLGSEMFGVLVQAQAADAIRRGGWLVWPVWSQAAEWISGALLAIILLLAARQTRGRMTWGVLAAALVVLPLASWLLFRFADTLFDPVRPLLLGSGAALAVFGALFSEARRERAVLRDAQNRTEGELDAARAIQLGMLPDRTALARLDPRIDIAAQLEAAKSVGGDFYDIIALDADRVMILIADVTGKGVPAALFMALSKALSRSVMLRSPGDLADTAAMLNTELMRDSGDALGLTMLLCLIDLATGRVEMVNAGHDNPLRITTFGEVIEEALEGGPPFCIMDYPWPAEHLTLLPGEALVLITDGVTEAQNRGEQLFGTQRTRDALIADQSSAAAMVATMCGAVRAFEQGTDPSDDLTVVAFRYLGANPG
ncbi:MAG: CHASE2 domain-containing protein [Blastomonas fulva]|uniref:CHASE2 domain-containing protein n=1 Tax=Blastomonas fulva TaxID=1550728 RepID=UPI0024E26597|nr:CHASE2 domain-containing protein [Blastomonas fulva]MDK2756553.1 CHASE2 domain-containing protein [Blastomonas fulva]